MNSLLTRDSFRDIFLSVRASSSFAALDNSRSSIIINSARKLGTDVFWRVIEKVYRLPAVPGEIRVGVVLAETTGCPRKRNRKRAEESLLAAF